MEKKKASKLERFAQFLEDLELKKAKDLYRQLRSHAQGMEIGILNNYAFKVIEKYALKGRENDARIICNYFREYSFDNWIDYLGLARA